MDFSCMPDFFWPICLYSALKKYRRSAITKFYGPKSFLFNKHGVHYSKPSFLTPVLIGSIFSLSFDTLIITTAFSLNGYALGGPIFPALLGITFMLGMMITDGLNGYVIASILTLADKRSQYYSCILDMAFGGFSLAAGSYLIYNLV